MKWRALIVWLAIITLCGGFWFRIARIGFGQYDAGGSVADYWIRVQTDHTPILGFCASACTMRLKNASCVAPDAQLVFHHATKPLGTRILLAMYSPALRAWFERQCDDGRLHLLYGSQMSHFGYKVCV